MKDGSCSASSGLWYIVRLAWVRTLLRHGDNDMLYLQGEWHEVGKSSETHTSLKHEKTIYIYRRWIDK
jgi:hypothetical protein